METLDPSEATPEIFLLHEQDFHGFYHRGLAKYRMGDQEGARADLKIAEHLCLELHYVSFQQAVLKRLQQISKNLDDTKEA